jgi:transposase
MAWLKHLPSKTQVQAVAMDMWAQYRTCVREVLPGAKIVIDAFHVLKLVSSCLETVRKTVRASLTESQVHRLMHDRFLLLRRPGDLSEQDRLILESWLGSLPLLGKAYARKEEFYAIYEATSQPEALDRYFAWMEKITPDLFNAFLPLMTAIENWGDEIFNYWQFDEAITNAFTEAKNGAVKVCNRVGRGYGLSAIRAKVLFAKEIAQDYEVKLPRLEVVST